MTKLLVGTIERLTFYNPENGYTVAQVTPEGRSYTVTVVGNLLDVSPGESLRLHGQWIAHPKYGRQFQVERYTTMMPATVAGIEKYLGSGLIKGIGPVTARRIVRRFKMDTLEIIEKDPHRLREVLGIGKKRVGLIQRAWEEQKAIKEVMIFLQSHNVSTAHAVRIYKTYGDAAIDVVRLDPYRLARDIHGIGFLTADKIARELGLAPDSPQRVEAGISYTLSQMANDGHVYAPQGELIHESTQILSVAPHLVQEGIERLAQSNEVHVEPLVYESREDSLPGQDLHEDRAVYLAPFYQGELGVANRLKSLIHAPRSRIVSPQKSDLDQAMDRLAGQQGVTLNAGQREAVITALTNKAAVMTGGPGTGKTTAIRTIIHLLETLDHDYALAAPTGRAAKRLSEATGRPAKTLHRLLEFKPQKGLMFQRNEENPLVADMVIVDETSMLDLLLTNHLLKAIHPESHLLLVGDVDQLPSVGAGNVLRDVIASGEAAVVRLTEIFRQAEGSLIIQNAHRINQGQMPIVMRDATDFFLFPADDAEAAADRIVDLVRVRIPGKFGLDPMEDIQVLSPMHRGAAGVSELNRRLQETLNPPGSQAERRIGSHVFRTGDRVMQIRNNYDKDVFNGDMGRITALDTVDQVLTVVIDGREVEYDFSELDELVHAYAVSVHKSQGSEYRAIVTPVLSQHYVMLQRNLLYTAVTRAKELVVLVGNRRAIGMAIGNNKILARHSALDTRLRGR